MATPLQSQIQPADSSSQQQQSVQQAQAQAASTQDPFKGVDLDLLDDQTKEAITKAQTDLQRLQTEAQQNSTAAQQLAETQQQLQQLQANQQHLQRQQTQQVPQTMDDELVQYYISQGIPAEQAQKVAKMNSGAFGILGRHLNQNISQQFAPLANKVVESNAADAFQSIQQNDPLNIMGTPEVRDKVWVRLNEMAQEGRLTSPEVAQNLARIYYMEHIEKNGMPDPNQINQPNVQQQQQPIFNPNVPRNQMQGIPRMPGNFNQPIVKQNKRELDMTPDEQAAMAATVAGWPIKPKAFQNNNTNKVTRGV